MSKASTHISMAKDKIFDRGKASPSEETLLLLAIAEALVELVEVKK